MAQKKGIQVYVNLKKDIYMEIIEKSKEKLTPRTTYAKYLLMNGLPKCEKDGVHIKFDDKNISDMAYENMTLYVPENIRDRIKQLSQMSMISVPVLNGYIIEKELERGE